MENFDIFLVIKSIQSYMVIWYEDANSAKD